MQSWKTKFVIAILPLALGLILGSAWSARRADAVRESPHQAAGTYSVVVTEAHNLIVTDNKTNILYFYTIDRDKEIGSELKLRGSIDLTEVGKPEIKPKVAGK